MSIQTPCVRSSELRSLFIVGTRPEAIKMAPVIKAAQHFGSGIDPIVCFTGQHKEMLEQVASYFEITPDIDLGLMRSNQTLSGLTSRALEAIEETIEKVQPDCVVAQGDTTTVLCAAMTAFYRKLPFVHVEAGLRTGDLYSPWPEEYNRRVAGLTASLHCAPTQESANNLLQEGIPPQKVHVTGNTVIDALLWTVSRERANSDVWSEKYRFLADRRMVLITGHRRENFGPKFESALNAILQLAETFPETIFLYPVHLNPNVREPVYRLLGQCSNIVLSQPAAYPEFVWLMDRATLIITDSGGVQEEAPSLGKPVLVTRETTERPEALKTGAVQLVGTQTDNIVEKAYRLLTDSKEYAARQCRQNPYGDGQAAQRIIQLMQQRNWEQSLSKTLTRAA